jgi:hypothetical protein
MVAKEVETVKMDEMLAKSSCQPSVRLLMPEACGQGREE